MGEAGQVADRTRSSGGPGPAVRPPLGLANQALPQLPGHRPELVPSGFLGEVQAGGDGAAGATDHVEPRIFGLPARQRREETAGALDLSPATIKNEWAFARAWLYRALASLDEPPPRAS